MKKEVKKPKIVKAETKLKKEIESKGSLRRLSSVLPDPKSQAQLGTTLSPEGPEAADGTYPTSLPQIEPPEGVGGFSLEDQRLICLVRTLNGKRGIQAGQFEPVVVDVWIEHGKPAWYKIDGWAIISRRPISVEPLNFLELTLIRYYKLLQRGLLVFLAGHGLPLQIDYDKSYQQVSLKDFQPSEWRK